VESEIRSLWFCLSLTVKLINCEAQTVTQPHSIWRPENFHWEQAGINGTIYAPLEGDRETPGEAYTYSLKMPAPFFGHYCFDAPAELTVLRGKVNLSSAGLREGERRELKPGIVYSVEAELPAIVVISTITPWPSRAEPGAPVTPGEGC
jgi:hypothetical protein